MSLSSPSLHMCMYSAEPGMCRASVLGYLIGAPLLLLFGSAGNLWTAVVATRCSLRRNQAAVLILAHALFDTLALWTGLTRHFVMNVSAVTSVSAGHSPCRSRLTDSLTHIYRCDGPSQGKRKREKHSAFRWQRLPDGPGVLYCHCDALFASQDYSVQPDTAVYFLFT